ncbi:MAG: hypothetical protein JW834_03260, partial [Candidatus Diapherotrites archaeon]|nr:hypothetical protein [Candidatus Diapherotrites archaeon]
FVGSGFDETFVKSFFESLRARQPFSGFRPEKAWGNITLLALQASICFAVCGRIIHQNLFK